MQKGKLNGQEAFMTGKLKVEGDLGFLMQIGQMMM
jgi:putative sterol carrier protein